jgi:hypothetical protein
VGAPQIVQLVLQADIFRGPDNFVQRSSRLVVDCQDFILMLIFLIDDLV